MAEYIGCRNCSSPDCRGCNVYTLAMMLSTGKFDCLMNGNRCVDRFADVAPVRHGRWLKTEEPLGWQEVDCIECSACHESWIADEDYGLDFADFWKYCPNCGARMDGGDGNGI